MPARSGPGPGSRQGHGTARTTHPAAHARWRAENGDEDGDGSDDALTGRVGALVAVTESAQGATLTRRRRADRRGCPEPERRPRTCAGGEHAGELPGPVAALCRVGPDQGGAGPAGGPGACRRLPGGAHRARGPPARNAPDGDRGHRVHPPGGGAGRSLCRRLRSGAR